MVGDFFLMAEGKGGKIAAVFFGFRGGMRTLFRDAFFGVIELGFGVSLGFAITILGGGISVNAAVFCSTGASEGMASSGAATGFGRGEESGRDESCAGGVNACVDAATRA